ncbi:flagellar basal-body rod protein FlgG [Simkania negevensis]|uniref:Flagellar basal-body rod protein FlgG n=1 Tax=Simkania negevensis TaxID=83561 RepID=A0ABS3APQ1_9BACT|nr:flagellar basal-body rod protein FlgG [Simkania negevensis]
MIRALWTAATGMNAQMTNIDVISNNLANVNTTGFKKSRAGFQDLLYQTLKAAGESTGPDTQHPVGQQVGVGSKLAAITKEFTDGSLTRTDRDLDIAIAGKGFIPITGADGETYYTRDGAFNLSNAGEIVTSEGYVLQNLGTVPSNARAVNFSPTGQVAYIDETGTENTLGQLQLALFVNPAGLSARGGNLYQISPASGEAIFADPGFIGAGTIQQRFLENSNVSIVQEMVNLITSQRAYEINSKAIKTADEMLATANQIAR